MPLKLRPTGLGSGIADLTIFSGSWEVGRIYETRGGPDSLRWFWSERQWANDTIEPRGDLGRGSGAISEELGQVDGVGEAGRCPLVSAIRLTKAQQTILDKQKAPHRTGPLPQGVATTGGAERATSMRTAPPSQRAASDPVPRAHPARTNIK
jgi:hypothetical protein